MRRRVSSGCAASIQARPTSHILCINWLQLLPNVFHAAREIFARAGWSVMVVDDDPAFITYPLQGSRQTLKVDLSLSEIAVRQHESPVLASGLLDLPVRQMHLLPLELVLAVDEIHAYQALR